MKTKIFPLILLISLLCIGMISAAPPVTTVQQIQEGYIISDSPQDLLKQNNNFTYNFFVYNISNGALKTNSSVSCIHYINNVQGKLIFYSNVLYNSFGYWSIEINAGNFSNTGNYYYGTKCNSSVLGGSTVGTWKVTPTGQEFSDPQSRIIIMGFGIIVIISLLLFVFGMSNHIIGVKIFSIGLSILMIFYALAYTLMSMNNAVYLFPGLSSVFQNLYFLSTVLLIVGGIGLLLFLISFALNAFYKSRGMRD